MVRLKIIFFLFLQTLFLQAQFDKDEKDTVVSQSIILETGLITSSSNQFPF